MYDANGLETAAGKVRKQLDEVFRFKYADDQVRAYLKAGPPIVDVQAEVLRISRLKGVDPCGTWSVLNGFAVDPDFATSIYTRDISDFDYSVFLSDISYKTPLILGEEITHGEHETEHTRRLGSNKDFYTKFSPPSIELLGYLGMDHIARTAPKLERSITISDSDYLECCHIIGYSVAKQLIDSGNVPHSDLFHAGDQAAIWSIAKDIVKPRILVSNRRRDFYPSLKEWLQITGLDAEIVPVDGWMGPDGWR